MRYKIFRELHKVNAQAIVPALQRAQDVCDDMELATALSKEQSKIYYCGDVINTIQCNHCGTNHFKSFDRCKSKFCSLCQGVKSRLWTMHLITWIKQWLEQGNYVVFLNLTIKDTDSLEEGMQQLEGAWRLMTGKRYRKAFLSKFPGGFKSIEVKTGENSGQWHPHIHALVLKDKFSNDTKFLHYVWPKCVAECGGEAVNLKILPFKRSPGDTDEEYDIKLAKSIREVCKYITKFDWENEQPERIGEMFRALHGKRQYSVWGALQQVRHEVANDFATKTEKQMLDFACQKCGCTAGHPNKLFRAIWDSPDEPIIADYKTTLPEELVTGEQLERLKALNHVTDAKQRVQHDQWVQQRIDSLDNVHRDPN